MDNSLRPKDKIHSLEEDLYSRSHPMEYRDERTPIPNQEIEAPRSWEVGEGEDIQVLIQKEREKRESSQSKLFKKIFFYSAFFFVVAIGVSLFMFFGGRNFISADKIDILVVGPTMTAGGEVLTLDAVIQNKNRVPLEDVSLIVEYPSGTRTAQDVNVELTRSRDEIGEVPARGESRKTISAILFGEKESVQEILLTVEYRLEGSTASFTKEKKYEIAIQSSPVIVTIQNPQEINANQEFEFSVDISANTPDPLRGVMFQAEYPFGFVFQSAQPAPSIDNNIWRVGDLPPGDKREIRIRGILQAQNDEERTFRFATGIVSATDEEKLGAIFSNIASSMKIRRPFLAVDALLSGRPTERVSASPGEKVNASVSWTNNLPGELLDAVVEVKLQGAVLDKSSVTASIGGFYRSIDNVIVWDKNSRKQQLSLSPGKKDTVNFSFSPIQTISSNAGSSQIDMVITVTGTQTTDTGKQEKITTVVNRSVLLASKVTLGARSVRSLGTIENFGPIPPRAEQEVSYTAVWTLSNTLNTVTDGVVKAVLPNYVTWRGLTAPSGESVQYDPLTREVTWNVGNIAPGTGNSGSPKELYFHVSFIPSVSQVGSSPVLVESATFTGRDRFTQEEIRTTSPASTTRFSTDPSFRLGDEIVAN